MRLSTGLAAGALLLATVALGEDPSRAPGRVDARDLAARWPEAQIEAVDLAERIRDGERPRVVDLRSEEAHRDLAVPTSTVVALESLPALAHLDAPIVLVGDDPARTARAWLLLRRLGHEDTLALRGGIVGWMQGVLEPVLPRDTPAEHTEYDRVAAIARFFGGIPRAGRRDPHTAVDAEQAVRLLRGKGCF